MATKKYVRKIVEQSVEKHFHRFGSNVPVSYDAALMQDVTEIVQGPTDLERTGDECHLRSISWRFEILGHATTTNGVRIMIFQWKGRAAPLISQLINSTGAALTTDSWAVDHYNHDNRKMFSVMYDESFAVAGVDKGWQSLVSGKGMYNIGLNAKRKLCNANCQFFAGTTTGTNHIWYLAMSTATAAGGSRPNVHMVTKTNFNG